VLIAIQLIRPAPNQNGQVTPADVSYTLSITDSVQLVLINSCYDCHSNNTRYPWYINVQPMGWIMARHVKEGKENLNFNEFGTYSKRKQANKLRSIATSIKEGTMPINSYNLMHKDARLSEQNKNLIIDWALKTKDSLGNN